jgi:hypothetical protein
MLLLLLLLLHTGLLTCIDQPAAAAHPDWSLT